MLPPLNDDGRDFMLILSNKFFLTGEIFPEKCTCYSIKITENTIKLIFISQFHRE